MNIILSSIGNVGSYNKRLVGVYKMTFDNGAFYIGSSIHLWSRFTHWKRVLRVGSTDKRGMWPSMTKPILGCDTATFEILELLPHKRLLFSKESDYMHLYKENPLMINVIINPRNEVLQYTKEMIFIKRYPSLKKAAEETGIFQRRIQDVVNGRKRSCKGFVFKYFDERAIKKPSKMLGKKEQPGYQHPRSRKILQVDNRGNVIAEYENSRIAAEKTKTDRRSLRHHLAGTRYINSIKGLIFKYA